MQNPQSSRIRKFSIPRQLSIGKTDVYGHSKAISSTADIAVTHPKAVYQTRSKAAEQTAYLQTLINARKAQSNNTLDTTSQDIADRTTYIQQQINMHRRQY